MAAESPASELISIPTPPLPTAAKWICPGQEIDFVGTSTVNSPADFWVLQIDPRVDDINENMTEHYNRLPPKTGFT